MQRRPRQLVFAALLLAPALMGAAAFWVLPRAEVPRDEPLPPGDWHAVGGGLVRDGGARYPAAGNVTVFEDRETLARIIGFEDYAARSGANVWFFLTPEKDPDARAELDEGVMLTVPGLGPAVARGTFWVSVPEDVSHAEMGAVVAWDRFLGNRHAVVTLTAASEAEA